jgi:hypothetical protein
VFDKKFVRRIFEIRQRKWQEVEGNCMIRSFVTFALPNNKIIIGIRKEDTEKNIRPNTEGRWRVETLNK